MKGIKRTKRHLGLLAILVGTLLVLGGCGAANDTATTTTAGVGWASEGGAVSDGDIEGPRQEETAAPDSGGGKDEAGDLDLPSLNPDPNRKIIVRTSLELETTDFDSVVDEILNKLVPQFKGYVESSEIYNNRLEEEGNRYAAIKLRIPTEDYSQAVTTISNLAHLVHRTDSAEDVTLTYVDTEAHITALKTEQATLLDLLEQADSIEDIISIQGRLTQVRYELEYYNSQLRQLDNLIDYTTLTLQVQEVRRLTTAEQEDFFTEAGRRLSNGWDSFVRGLRRSSLNLIGALPWVVTLLILLAVVLIIVRATRPRRQRRRAERARLTHPRPDGASNQPQWQGAPQQGSPQRPPRQTPPQADKKDGPPESRK